MSGYTDFSIIALSLKFDNSISRVPVACRNVIAYGMSMRDLLEAASDNAYLINNSHG